jgi:hypothetical protein
VPKGLPDVNQKVGVDGSDAVSGYKEVAGAAGLASAANDEVTRSLQEVERAAQGVARSMPKNMFGSIEAAGAINAAIREQQALMASGGAAARMASEAATAAMQQEKETVNAVIAVYGARQALAERMVVTQKALSDELTNTANAFRVQMADAARVAASEVDKANLSIEKTRVLLARANAEATVTALAVGAGGTTGAGFDAAAMKAVAWDVAQQVASRATSGSDGAVTAATAMGAAAAAEVLSGGSGSTGGGSGTGGILWATSAATAARIAARNAVNDFKTPFYSFVYGATAEALAGGGSGGGGYGGGDGGGGWNGSSGNGFLGPFAGAAAGAAGGLLARSPHDAASQFGTVSAWLSVWYPRIHWALMATNELLATAGPAIIAGTAASLVGLEGGQTAYDRLFAINAVGQSLGGSLGQTPGQFLGLGDALQKAQTSADPAVWELMGAAINSVKGATDNASGGLSNFWQLGTNTIDMLDRFAAKVTTDFKGGVGKELSSVVSQGTSDLQQFGDVVGNIGRLFLNVVPSLPGVGGDILTLLSAGTGALASTAGFLGKTGLLGPLLAGEAGLRYGPALVGGLGSLVGKAGGGLLGLGDLGTDLAASGVSSDVVLGAATGITGLGTILGTAAKGARLATAADVDAGLATTIGETIGPTEGSGIAGALGAATGPTIAGVAALTYLVTKAALAKTPAEQAAATQQSAINQSTFTSAFSSLMTGMTQAAQGAASGTTTPSFMQVIEGGQGKGIRDESIGDMAINFIKEGLAGLPGLGGLAMPTNRDVAQQQLASYGQQFSNLLSAGPVMQQMLGGGSIQSAYDIADMAGLQASQLQQLISGTAAQKEDIQNQLLNEQAGYKVMAASPGVYGANVAAVQAMKGLAGSQLTTVNSAWDQILQNAAGGTGAATGFASGLSSLQTLGSSLPTAEAQAEIAKLDPKAAKASISSIAKALVGFSSTASQEAWSAFSNASTTSPGLIQQIGSLGDWLRTAQTASPNIGQGQFNQAVLYEARQALPYAKDSPAALAQLGVITQQAGGPGYSAAETQKQNLAAIGGFIDRNAGSQKQFNAVMNEGSIALANVSAQALNFGATLKENTYSALAGGATGLPQVSEDMARFKATIDGGINTSAFKGAARSIASDLAGVSASAGDVGAILNASLSGKGLSTGEIANAIKLVQSDMSALTVPVKPKLDASALAAPTQEAIRSIAGAHDAVMAGIMDYKAKVDTPVAPPPPKGGVVEYTTRVPKPIAPPAPMGGTVVYHSVVIGPGQAGIIGGGGTRFMAQSGFRVPGFGGGDIVPAMLEPGEAVVPKHLVSALAPFLAANKVPGFQAGGFAGAEGFGASTLSFSTMYSSMLEALESMVSGIASGLSESVQNTLSSYARGSFGGTMRGTPAASSAPSGTPSNPVAVELVSNGMISSGGGGIPAGAMGALPIPAAAQKVIDAFEKTFAGMGNPWGNFASQIMQGLLDSIKDASKETAAEAKALTAKVTQEVNFAKSTAATAVSGLNFAGMTSLPTPTMTAQGQPYQYYADQASGNPLSVQQQMGDYLQSIQSFSGDIGKLSKGGLNKSLIQQLLGAGPLQGDQEAQSILGGAGGVGAVNNLWKQINSAANKLGIGGAEAVYGYGGVGSKTVSVKAQADAAPVHALQAAINAVHGKTVDLHVNVTVGSGGQSMSVSQINQIVAKVQSQLLEQAKRNRKTGLMLPGYGS